MRRLWPAVFAACLCACGSVPVHQQSPVVMPQAAGPHAARSTPATKPRIFANACAPTREHRDSDYTPGGLYAPGVADGRPASPIDVSAVLEPVPRSEPRARTGNRSPYTVLGKSYHVLDRADGYSERGIASWYGTKFNGRATSSGELYDMCVFTAAHKTLPLPSFVRVTNLDNGRSLVVRVNDRGPFHAGRVMDLSYAAAVRLGVDRTGTARVQLQAIGGSDGQVQQVGRSGAADGNGRVVQVVSSGENDDNLRVVSSSEGNDHRNIVQVGSFGERANARRLADRLQEAGVDDVDIDRAEVSGNDVWRVRIGPVRIEKLAALLDQLRSLNLPDPRVLRQ